MIRYLIVIFALIFAYYGCKKDHGTVTQVASNKYGMIKGVVKDSISSSFIDSAKITIELTNQIIYTDSLGQYLFPGLLPNRYKVSVSKFGYAKTSKFSDVFADDTTVTNFRLSSLEKFIFNVSEGFIPLDTICKPFTILYLKTERIFGSSDRPIIYSLNYDQTNINIDLLGIGGGNNTAVGPARAEIVLDINVGDYSIFIKNDSYIDKYNLKVTDSYIKLIKSESIFTILEFGLYWRYPPNSFVYTCGTTTQTSWICDEFVDSLFAHIQLQEFYFPDSGKICYPNSSQGHYFDMPARYFNYNSENDFDIAGNILISYAQNTISQYSGIGITLWNWKNKHYLSWLYY